MYSTPQNFQFATPPALGSGAGYSLRKSPKFNILAIDKYGTDVTSKDQYSNQNNLYYNVDVRYPNGTMAPSGENYSIGIKDPNYSFTYDDNYRAFHGSPKRQYTLVFKLIESSPSTVSSGKFNVYHNEAQISGISQVLDGTLRDGSYRNRTGTIDINLTTSNSLYYNMSKFEIYSGNYSAFPVVTGTGAGANLMKSISVFNQSQNYTLTINDGEQPFDNNYYFYKILPYDDFGSGVLYSSPPISGKMYSIVAPAFSVNTVTGKNIVLLNDGKYTIQTYHNGNITGTGYEIIDAVANISGNIMLGGYYNVDASGDFTQNSTYLFKTIKYLAQITDGTGNVSSREILITDNSTATMSGANSGIPYSEYAISDNNKSAQFFVSGSGYANGTGLICLLSKVSYPTGTYKLLRTIL
jgi:hypothetical protein